MSGVGTSTAQPGPAESAPAPKSPIQAIDRAASLLSTLATVGPAGAPLRLLAATAELNTSTAHTLLASLVANGFVEQDEETRHYRLGNRVLVLSRIYLANADLATAGAPIVRDLWEQTEETVHLSVLRHWHRVDLVVLTSPQVLSVNPAIRRAGRLNDPDAPGPFHGTAAGKVLLAGIADEQIRALLAKGGVPVLTPRTLPDEPSVLAEVDRVRRQGYATNREEEVAGVYGVAAPVVDATGSTVAALCIGYPAARASEEYERDLRDAVVAGAERLSRLLSPPATDGTTTGGT